MVPAPRPRLWTPLFLHRCALAAFAERRAAAVLDAARRGTPARASG